MQNRDLALAIAAFTAGVVATATFPSSALKDGGPRAKIVRLAEAPRSFSPSGSAQVIHLARGLNAYVGRLSMKPGAKVPVHRDATEEFIHILEGSGTITIAKKTHTVRAGDTIYMPAGEEVSFANGDAPLVGLQVFAGPGPAKKYEAWKPAE